MKHELYIDLQRYHEGTDVQTSKQANNMPLHCNGLVISYVVIFWICANRMLWVYDVSCTLSAGLFVT